MTLGTWTDLVNLIAIAGFILALKGLSSPRHARRGNLIGAAAAALAIGMTFSNPALRHQDAEDVANHHLNIILIVITMVIGAAIAVPAARMVKMTAIPQMVAIFNGVGGGAAALVSVTELLRISGTHEPVYKIGEVLFGVLVDRCRSPGAPSRSPSCRS